MDFMEDDLIEQRFLRGDRDDYDARREEGLLRSTDLSVGIFGIARNLGKRFEVFSSYIEVLEGIFGSAATFLYENDSTDSTPEQIRDWCDRSPVRTCVSEVLGNRKFPSVRSAERCELLGQHRSRVKSMADDLMFDYCIMIDTDMMDYPIGGLMHSLSFARQFDWMASNGLKYHRGAWVPYDAWAFRQHSWQTRSFRWLKNKKWPIGSELIPVWSAFGGLAIYHWEAWNLADYAGDGDIEHATFHRRLREQGFDSCWVNPSMVTLYG